MKLIRVLLPVLVFGILAFAPHQALAASATFFGPIIPPECHCVGSAPDFGCVLQVIENTMNFAISIGVIIFVLVASYAGFLWMFSPMNPHNREQGRSILLNAVIGLLITLCAWLLVDFVMKTLYNGEFGPWNSILSGGNTCLQPITPPAGGQIVDTPGGVTTGTGSGANCPAADPSSVVAFPSEASAGGSIKATQQTVQNFMTMRAAALQENIDLKVVSGYRSDAEQVAIWNDRNCGSGTCTGGPVAKPCSLGGNGSNHNSGRAVDIANGCSPGNSSCNTPAYNWLKSHGAQYGFQNAVSSDLVHYSPNGH